MTTLHYTLLPDGRLRVLVDRPEPVRHPWRAAVGIAFGVGVFLGTLTLAHGEGLGPPEAMEPGTLDHMAITAPAPPQGGLTIPGAGRALVCRSGGQCVGQRGDPPRGKRVRYCTGSETEKVHCRDVREAEAAR